MDNIVVTIMDNCHMTCSYCMVIYHVYNSMDSACHNNNYYCIVTKVIKFLLLDY